jgi:hypothetical protein
MDSPNRHSFWTLYIARCNRFSAHWHSSVRSNSALIVETYFVLILMFLFWESVVRSIVLHTWNEEWSSGRAVCIGSSLGYIYSSKRNHWVRRRWSLECQLREVEDARAQEITRCWLRNISIWLAEVVWMPKSSVYIQLSNGGFFRDTRIPEVVSSQTVNCVRFSLWPLNVRHAPLLHFQIANLILSFVYVFSRQLSQKCTNITTILLHSLLKGKRLLYVRKLFEFYRNDTTF